MELCEQASGARMHTALYRPFFFDFSVFSGSFINELAQFLTRCARSLSGAFLGLLNNRSMKSRLAGVGQVSKTKVQAYGLSGIIARSAGVFLDQRYFNISGGIFVSSRTFIGKRGDNLDRFLIRIKETAESFGVLSQTIQLLRFKPRNNLLNNRLSLTKRLKTQIMFRQRLGHQSGLVCIFSFFFLSYCTLVLSFQKIKRKRIPTNPIHGLDTNFIQAAVSPSRGKFSSMESLITHFRLTSEG